MSELEPCPFCGGVADEECYVSYDEEGSPTTDPAHTVICTRCSAETDTFDTIDEAIDAWNRRARDLAHRQLAERAHRLGGYTLTEYDLDGAVYQILVVEEVSEAVGDAVSEIVNLLDAGGADGLGGQPPTSAEVQR